MNRRTQERRKSTETLGQIICACNEAKLRATIEAQETRIAALESLLARAGGEIANIPWMQRSEEMNVMLSEIDNILRKS